MIDNNIIPEWSAMSTAQKANFIRYAVSAQRRGEPIDLTNLAEAWRQFYGDYQLACGGKLHSKGGNLLSGEDTDSQDLENPNEPIYNATMAMPVITPRGTYTDWTGNETYKPTIRRYMEDAAQKARVNATLHILNQEKPNIPHLPKSGFANNVLATLGVTDNTRLKILGEESDAPTCIYTVTNQYGDPEAVVPGNKTFAENPSKYGFVQIPMDRVNVGDLIQFGFDNIPHHTTMVTGFSYGEEPVLSYSTGSRGEYSEPILSENDKLPRRTMQKDIELSNVISEDLQDPTAYMYVGSPQQRDRWFNEYRKKYNYKNGGNLFFEGGQEEGESYVNQTNTSSPVTGIPFDIYPYDELTFEEKQNVIQDAKDNNVDIFKQPGGWIYDENKIKDYYNNSSNKYRYYLSPVDVKRSEDPFYKQVLVNKSTLEPSTYRNLAYLYNTSDLDKEQAARFLETYNTAGKPIIRPLPEEANGRAYSKMTNTAYHSNKPDTLFISDLEDYIAEIAHPLEQLYGNTNFEQEGNKAVQLYGTYSPDIDPRGGKRYRYPDRTEGATHMYFEPLIDNYIYSGQIPMYSDLYGDNDYTTPIEATNGLKQVLDSAKVYNKRGIDAYKLKEFWYGPLWRSIRELQRYPIQNFMHKSNQFGGTSTNTQNLKNPATYHSVVNPFLIDFVIKEEGFLDKPTNIGDGKITIGSGLTDPKWIAKYRRNGNKWTTEDNLKAVEEELLTREAELRKLVPNWDNLPDSSKQGLLSYKYNYNFTEDNSPKMFDALRSGNLQEAARQMDATSKDPKFIAGLLQRRAREQKLFLQDVINGVGNQSWHEGLPQDVIQSQNPVVIEPKRVNPIYIPVDINNNYVEARPLTEEENTVQSFVRAVENQRKWDNLMNKQQFVVPENTNVTIDQIINNPWNLYTNVHAKGGNLFDGSAKKIK